MVSPKDQLLRGTQSCQQAPASPVHTAQPLTPKGPFPCSDLAAPAVPGWGSTPQYSEWLTELFQGMCVSALLPCLLPSLSPCFSLDGEGTN